MIIYAGSLDVESNGEPLEYPYAGKEVCCHHVFGEVVKVVQSPEGEVDRTPFLLYLVCNPELMSEKIFTGLVVDCSVSVVTVLITNAVKEPELTVGSLGAMN